VECPKFPGKELRGNNLKGKPLLKEPPFFWEKVTQNGNAFGKSFGKEWTKKRGAL